MIVPADFSGTPRIFLVEDEALIAADLAGKLTAEGYSVAGMAASGEEAINLVPVLSPDLILMDIRIRGELDGIDTALALKSISNSPVVFLTAHSDRATVARACKAGPYGFVTKPALRESLIATVETAVNRWRQEKAETSELRSLAYGDPLTGIPNRRFLMEECTRRLSARLRPESGGSVWLFDIDRFKAINDVYGHAQGDRMLRLMACLLNACVRNRGMRNSDLVCRLGGDEFCLLMFDTPVAEGVSRIECITGSFAAESERQGSPATCSFGAADLPPDATDIDGALFLADRRLYEAKARRTAVLPAQTPPVPINGCSIYR